MAVVCVVGIALNPTTAAAFKSKAHVAVANAAMSELDGFRIANMFGLGPIALGNEEVMAAIRDYPDQFRAGALGPDSYPDLFAGQYWVHVNKGCPEGPPCVDASGAALTASGVVLDKRSFGQWRPIDYAMYQLREALAFSGNAELRRQAIAFSYGYLAHVVSDGFVHGWINEWTQDLFDIKVGRGLFGPATEEFQHIALEGYLDKHLVAGATPVSIATPVPFLSQLYRSGNAGDNDVKGMSAGAFAGAHFEALIQLRDLFDGLSDRTRWPATLGVDPTFVKPLLSLSEDAEFVPFVSSPLKDIEDYFGRRRDVIDNLLNTWVALSGCVAQNLTRALVLPPGTKLLEDACQAIDFESTSKMQEVFGGGSRRGTRTAPGTRTGSRCAHLRGPRSRRGSRQSRCCSSSSTATPVGPPPTGVGT